MLGTTLLLAFRSIRRHLLRSCLTVLGVVIGVAAVVTMTTLGNATSAAVQKSIANLGTNVLHVHPGGGFGRGGGGPRPPDFKPEDVIAIEQQVAGVTAVAGQAQASVTAIYNGNNWSTTLFGMNDAYFEVQPWPLAEGRIFTPAEEGAGKAVCIIGSTVSSSLFKTEDPIGKRFRIGSVSCTVIGLLTTKGQAQFGDQDDMFIMSELHGLARRTGAHVCVLAHMKEGGIKDPKMPPPKKDLYNQTQRYPDLIFSIALDSETGDFRVAIVKTREGRADPQATNAVVLGSDFTRCQFFGSPRRTSSWGAWDGGEA